MASGFKFPIFGKRRRQELQELHLLGSSNNSDDDYDWAADESKEVDKQLKAVFDKIDSRGDGVIDTKELAAALRNLGVSRAHGVAQEVIWEVDEDMDGFIGYAEFKSAYERAAEDKLGREPRKLYNIVEFSMADDDDSATLTVDEALECYGRRYGVKRIDAVVKKLFTEEERSNPSTELSFQQYCERDAVFLAEACRQHRESLLDYGRLKSEGEMPAQGSRPRPEGIRPVWRGAGVPRSSTSLGFTQQDTVDLLLKLGVPPTAAAAAGLQGRRRSVPQGRRRRPKRDF